MSRVQMVENNNGSLSRYIAATVCYKACYERAGYRELWPKHELSAKLFFGKRRVFRSS